MCSLVACDSPDLAALLMSCLRAAMSSLSVFCAPVLDIVFRVFRLELGSMLLFN